MAYHPRTPLIMYASTRRRHTAPSPGRQQQEHSGAHGVRVRHHHQRPGGQECRGGGQRLCAAAAADMKEGAAAQSAPTALLCGSVGRCELHRTLSRARNTHSVSQFYRIYEELCTAPATNHNSSRGWAFAKNLT